jgi:hypothetical protein
MKQLLEKLSKLKDGYARLSKATPDPTTARRQVDQTFREVIVLLERPTVVDNLDFFLTSARANQEFGRTARSYIDANRTNFVKGETELTRPILRPNEIQGIIDTFLCRYENLQLIQNSAELRERLLIMHNSYCQGMDEARDQPKKPKKKAKLKLNSGVMKMLYGAGMLSANTYSFVAVPQQSPASIVSCLAGITALSEGLEKLQN